MKCECAGPHLTGHRHGNELVPVERRGLKLKVCTECVLSSDTRLDKEKQAWKTVQTCAEDALAALQSVNESPMTQSTLIGVIERAKVHQTRWDVRRNS